MRSIARPALRIALSLGLVALVLWLTDGADALSLLARADPGWLAMAALLLTAQTLLMAHRWRLTSARLGLVIGLKRAVGEYYLAQIVNMTLPGGVVGDAARAVRTREAGLTRAAKAVMVERLAGQAALLAVMLSGFALAFILPGGIGWPIWVPALLVALTAAAALIALAMNHGKAPTALRSFAAACQTALLAPDIRWTQAALCLTIAALNLLAFAACAQATGTTLPPEAIATLIPLILTAMLIPLSVAGWGWREGAAAALFPLAGATAAAGVAASLAFGLVLLAASLPGILWPILAASPQRALPQGQQGPRPAKTVEELAEQGK